MFFENRQKILWLLLILCVVALFANLGRQVVERSQELRVALTARNMVESGNWLVPQYDGALRLQKPPLMYWIVGGVYELSGSTGSAFLSRLPTATFGILLLLGIYTLGRIAADRETALLAALVSATTIVFQRFARLAETDIPLICFTTWALVLYFAARQRKHHVLWWVLAGAVAGFGFLSKGLAALAVFFTTVILHGLCDPSRRRAVFSWRLIALIVPFALVALPWYVLLWLRPEAHQVLETTASREVGVLVVSSEAHPGPFYYYVDHLPLLLLPWGGLLPFALWRGWRRRADEGLRFMLVWFAVTFVLLSALQSKQQHYTVLLLPASGLLIAHYITRALADAPGWDRRIVRGYLALIVVLLLAAAAALICCPSELKEGLPTSIRFAGGALLLLLTGGAWLWYRRKDWGLIGVLVIVMAAAGQTYILFAHKADCPDTIVTDFVEEIEPQLRSAQAVRFVGDGRLSFAFYVDVPFTESETLKQAWRSSAPGDVILAISNKHVSVDMQSIPVPPSVRMTRADWACAMYVKGNP